MKITIFRRGREKSKEYLAHLAKGTRGKINLRWFGIGFVAGTILGGVPVGIVFGLALGILYGRNFNGRGH